MIRKFFYFILILLCAGAGGLVAFFYWGSSPKLSSNQYLANKSYPNASPLPSDSVFTIITYNIGYLSGMTNNKVADRTQEFLYQNLAYVIQTFKQIQPDIVTYQEIDYGGDRSFDINQSEKIAQTLGFAYQLDAINWDKVYVPFPYSWNPTYHFGRVLSGQSLHTHFPVLTHERLVLERTNLPFYEQAFYIDRLAQVVKLKIRDREVVIINVHLEAFDAPTRMKHGKVVTELFERYAKYYPVILLGDFNSPAPTEASRQNSDYEPTIDEILKITNLKSAVAPEHFGKKEFLTYPADNPTIQIDYIFYTSDKIECLASRVVTEVKTASDHLPVLMKFRFLD
ncbi:endonuclease/exonuclease/phosphatase family protein [Thermoflexibacter ruber]|uniref:Metal-dependent hydrolase, endonuclease/exonuclease/phosphatase family n=1 Tax=Thermoflexibacter ruber TaxID=1003 RepID=A0A1I2HRP8_9BACT|nr:endonuclease/exonuclease/phosphatase family protein [Thermoflexibacter ruber]SFF31386.1 Metal-dependent hydrolase, endonuclease/exonuclease/phosphatase family [Thermoflexibacter ruber]